MIRKKLEAKAEAAATAPVIESTGVKRPGDDAVAGAGGGADTGSGGDAAAGASETGGLRLLGIGGKTRTDAPAVAVKKVKPSEIRIQKGS